MVAVVDAPTALVLMVNVAPAGTVTVEGTLATALPLDSVTCAPPGGAGPLNVTIPVEDCAPPTTLAGFNVNPLRIGPGNGKTGRLRLHALFSAGKGKLRRWTGWVSKEAGPV